MVLASVQPIRNSSKLSVQPQTHVRSSKTEQGGDHSALFRKLSWVAEQPGRLTQIKLTLGFCYNCLPFRREGQVFLIYTFVSHVKEKCIMFVTSLRSLSSPLVQLHIQCL